MTVRIREFLIHPHFVRLLLGRAFSLFGSNVAYTALAAYIYQRTKSGTVVGLVELVNGIPAVALGFIAGAAADRHGRKPVLVFALAVQTASWVLLALQPSITLLLLLLVVSGSAGAFYYPALTASIPALVPKDRLLRANSLTETTLQVVQVVGPAAGGLGVVALGFTAVGLFNAFTFLVAGLVIASLPIPGPLPPTGGVSPGGVWRNAREGFFWMRSQPMVLAFLIGSSLMTLGGGAVTVMIVVFLTRVLGGTTAQFGLIISLVAAGGVAGALIPMLSPGRHRSDRSFRIYTVLTGLAMLVMACSRHWWFFGATLVLIGVLQTAAGVYADTWLMEWIPNEVLARVTSFLEMATGGLRILSMALAASTCELIGIRALYLAAAGVFLLGGIVMAVGLRGREGPEACAVSLTAIRWSGDETSAEEPSGGAPVAP